MLRVNLFGRLLLEGIGGGDLGRGDDSTCTVWVGDGALARFGFRADAAAGVVVGHHCLGVGTR